MKLGRRLGSLNESVLFLLREEPSPALTIEVTNFCPFVKLGRRLGSLNESVLFLLREEPSPALTIEVTNF